MPPKFTPRAHQRPGVAHICEHARSSLFMPMGGGKTGTVLEALEVLALADDPFPVLVIGPLRVSASTWPDEVRKWSNFSHRKVVPILGDKAARVRALRTKADIHTINFENIQWLMAELGDDWPWPTVVFDEATRLKSFRTRQGGQRPKALAKVAHTKIKRWIGLTGTPAPNGIADLYGQLWFIDAGQRLGRSFSAFEQRWFRPDYSGFGMIPLPHSQAEIEGLISDVCLTVQAMAVDEPIVNTIYVDLPKRARALYEDMAETYFALLKADTEIEAFSAAAKSQKLLQFASGAVYTETGSAEYAEVHDEKIRALESVIEEAAGAPVLVSYHFKSSLSRIQRAFPKARVLDAKPGTIREWNEGRIAILLAHPASAGHGINLQDGGNIICHVDVDWNLEHHDQINERIGPLRQKQSGHNRPVYHHYILARDTIDELVVDRLRTKRDIQTVLLEAMRRKA